MTDDVKIWAVVLTNGAILKGERIEFSGSMSYETPRELPDHLALHSEGKVCIVPWSSVLYLIQGSARPVDVSTQETRERMSEAWMSEHQEGEIVQVGLSKLGECRCYTDGYCYDHYDLSRYCALIEDLVDRGYLKRIKETEDGIYFKTTKAGEKYAQAQGRKGYYVPW